MNDWSELLQALHSAMMEELSERFPHAKFELGLPRRVEKLAFPPTSTQSLVTQVRIGDFSGVVTVGYGMGQNAKEVAQIMDQVKKRATKEFTRRRISPQFGVYAVHRSGEIKPAWLQCEPSVIIWLPIQVLVGKTPLTFDLGVGL